MSEMIIDAITLPKTHNSFLFTDSSHAAKLYDIKCTQGRSVSFLHTENTAHIDNH